MYNKTKWLIGVISFVFLSLLFFVVYTLLITDGDINSPSLVILLAVSLIVANISLTIITLLVIVFLLLYIKEKNGKNR